MNIPKKILLLTLLSTYIFAVDLSDTKHMICSNASGSYWKMDVEKDYVTSPKVKLFKNKHDVYKGFDDEQDYSIVLMFHTAIFKDSDLVMFEKIYIYNDGSKKEQGGVCKKNAPIPYHDNNRLMYR